MATPEARGGCGNIMMIVQGNYFPPELEELPNEKLKDLVFFGSQLNLFILPLVSNVFS